MFIDISLRIVSFRKSYKSPLSIEIFIFQIKLKILFCKSLQFQFCQMFVHVATQIPPSLDHRKFAQFLSFSFSWKKKYIYTHIHTHRKRNKSHLTNMTHLSPLVPQSAEIAEIKIGHRRFVLSGRLSKLDKSPPFPSTTTILHDPNKKKKDKRNCP